MNSLTNRGTVLVVLIALVLSGLVANATHGWPTEVRYEYIGDTTGNPLEYMVYWRTYGPRNAPISAGAVAQYNISSSCFATFTGYLQLYYEPGDSILPSGRIFPSYLYNCSVQSDFGTDTFGFVRWKGRVILPDSCHDILFTEAAFICCLIDADNTQASIITGTRVTLNNTIDSNSSPNFNEPLFQTACKGMPSVFDHSAFDEDGDSLYFSYRDVGSWETGYNYAKPLPSDTMIYWDNHTGKMYFRPDVAGRFLLSLEVKEYRLNRQTNTYYLISESLRQNFLLVADTCRPIANTSVFNPPVLPFCGSDTLIIKGNSAIACNTISGTEFRLICLDDGIARPIVGITADSCVDGFATTLKLQLHAPINYDANFIIEVQKGFDGNTFLNECGGWMLENDTIPFSTVSCGTGLSNIPASVAEALIELYPNPASDQLNMTFPQEYEGHTAEFRLIGYDGQIALNWSEALEARNPLEIDIATLPTGFYIMYVLIDEQLIVKEFIKAP